MGDFNIPCAHTQYGVLWDRARNKDVNYEPCANRWRTSKVPSSGEDNRGDEFERGVDNKELIFAGMAVHTECPETLPLNLTFTQGIRCPDSSKCEKSRNHFKYSFSTYVLNIYRCKLFLFKERYRALFTHGKCFVKVRMKAGMGHWGGGGIGKH